MTYLNASLTLMFLFAAITPTTDTTISDEMVVLNEVLATIKVSENWTKSGAFKELNNDEGATNLTYALKKAYEKVLGTYRHRGLASKALRTAIKAHPKYIRHIHPIYGFNKQENVSHEDIITVIKSARDILLTY